MNNTSVWYSSKYCNPAMGDIGGDVLQIQRQSTDVQNAQLVYLNCGGSWYPTPLICTDWIRRMLNIGGPSTHLYC